MFPPKKILCPTDFSDASLQALGRAAELAAHFQAEVHLVHVLTASPRELAPQVDAVDVRAAVERELRKLAEPLSARNIQVRVVLGEGDAAAEIVRIAHDQQADLIVIATHGTTGWRHLAFGSVTEKVVRLADCPVLTIRIAEAHATAGPR
jgi:nucleotide-binding universal stress UspA family protein